MYAIQSMEVKKCSEISYLLWKHCQNWRNAMIFLVHQCDVKGCKENLVIDRNFDNNMECCMAKESGYIECDSFPGQIMVA